MNIEYENLGTINKNVITITRNYAWLKIWFSYATPVSFQSSTGQKLTRVNDWSTTTGKLLNQLEPNKKNRVESNIFLEDLEKAIKSFCI